MTKRIVALLLLIFSASRMAASPSSPGRLVLEVGDVNSLKTSAEASLRLSQKHVIEVTEEGHGVFRLIALRSGVVYVRSLDAQGQTLESWVIEVLARSGEGRTDILRHPRWQPMLCQEPGIRCDTEGNQILGQTESLSWLNRSRELCEKHPPCRFAASLSAAAQSRWSRQLAQELSVSAVQVSRDGFISLPADCQGTDVKREEQWRRWLMDRYGAPSQVICQNQDLARFRLDVLALAHKSSASDLDNPLQLGPVRLLPDQPIEVFLRGLSQASDTRILARPQLALNLGSSIELSDGMDIATLAPQHDQVAEVWKAVGFLLQLKLLEQRGHEVRVAVTLQLSRPREGQRALDRSALQTETWLSVDQLQLVGHIQARTDAFEESRIPWLGSIPLLGALFRWKVENNADSQVYLLLRLQRQSLPLPDQQQLQKEAPKGIVIGQDEFSDS